MKNLLFIVLVLGLTVPVVGLEDNISSSCEMDTTVRNPKPVEKIREKNQPGRSPLPNKKNKNGSDDLMDKLIRQIDSVDQKANLMDTNNVGFKDAILMTSSTRRFPDVSNYYAECYLNIVNQYGFWKGVGKPLSKSEIKHASGYFKLLRPKGLSSNAPFTHLQIFGTHGQLENNSYGPYLANPFGNDNGISLRWRYELEEVCQCEKISRDGILIQENMYDSSGTLILQYFPTTVSENHIMGHYVDPWGALAVLRDNSDVTYISIHLDSNGYMASIAFMDKDGRLKRNSDDAFMTQYENDKNGNQIRVMSADIFGNPIIDNYGNCGWVNTYDYRGNILTGRCINHRGEPMRMPKKQKDATDAWQYKRHYDKWGRLDTLSYYDSTGKPDTVTGSIHRHIYEYDEYGNLTSYRTEGLSRTLVNFGDDLAWLSRKYDKRGNIIRESRWNKDTLLTSDGTCVYRYEYMQTGAKLTLGYKTTDGHDTILTYKHFESGKCDTTWYYGGQSINIVNKDSLGRALCDVYYDMNMNPIISINGYHKLEYEYIVDTQKRSSIEVKRLTDSLGNPCDMTASRYWRDYNIQITEIDSIKHTKIFSKFDGQKLLERYGYYYTDDFSSSIGDIDFDIIGMPSRSYHNNPLCYTAVATRTESGKVMTICGRNEFDEPSYILYGDYDGSAIYCMDISSDRWYYDEYGDTIPWNGNKSLKNNLYKSFCVELIDSIGLNLGLRSGDLIVSYGDWNYPEPSRLGRAWENTLIYETAIKASTEKDVIVIRHHPEKQSSELVKITLPEGTPKQLGFVYHMLYMTSKEKERYEQTVKAQGEQVGLTPNNTNFDGGKRINFIVPYKFNGDTSYTFAFRNGFDENAIILAWQLFDKDKTSFFNCYRGCSSYYKFINQDYDSIALYYTVDGVTAKRWTMHVSNENMFFNSTYCSNTNEFNNTGQFRHLSDSLQREYEASHEVHHEHLSPHQVEARLLELSGTRKIEVDTTVFSKNGWYYGDVKKAYRVIVNWDSLSIEEIIKAEELLAHIDYSDYTYILNKTYDYAYFHEEKRHFNEAVWTYDNSIMFLEGDLTMRDKLVLVITAEADGQLGDAGIVGDYVLLQYNEWFFGMNNIDFERVINNAFGEEKTIIIAPITEKDGKVILGRKKKHKFKEGELEFSYYWMTVSDEIFKKAYKYGHR